MGCGLMGPDSYPLLMGRNWEGLPIAGGLSGTQLPGPTKTQTCCVFRALALENVVIKNVVTSAKIYA